jgi:hypothetical protein
MSTELVSWPYPKSTTIRYTGSVVAEVFPKPPSGATPVELLGYYGNTLDITTKLLYADRRSNREGSIRHLGEMGTIKLLDLPSPRNPDPVNMIERTSSLDMYVVDFTRRGLELAVNAGRRLREFPGAGVRDYVNRSPSNNRRLFSGEIGASSETSETSGGVKLSFSARGLEWHEDIGRSLTTANGSLLIGHYRIPPDGDTPESAVLSISGRSVAEGRRLSSSTSEIEPTTELYTSPRVVAGQFAELAFLIGAHNPYDEPIPPVD